MSRSCQNARQHSAHHLGMSFDERIPRGRRHETSSVASVACDYAVGKADEWRLEWLSITFDGVLPGMSSQVWIALAQGG